MEDFFEKYRRYAAGITDAPAAFHDFVARTVVAAAMGSRTSIRLGGRIIRPNLWVLLLAPSSVCRKTTAIDIGSDLLERANPEAFLPSWFYPEVLEAIVESTPAGLLRFADWRQCACHLRRDRRSGGGLALSELYDSPPGAVCDAAVSIIGEADIDGHESPTDDSGPEIGGLSRFLFVPARAGETSLLVPGKPDAKLRGELVRQLRRIAGTNELTPEEVRATWAAVAAAEDAREAAEEAARRGEVAPAAPKAPDEEEDVEGSATLSPDAAARFEHWSRVFDESTRKAEGTALVPFYSRMQVHLLKLALIEQAVKEEIKEVGPESIDAAGNLCVDLARTVKELFAEGIPSTKFERLRRRVLRTIEARGKITRTELLKSMHVSSRELSPVVSTLLEEQRIAETVEGGGKEAKAVYSAVPEGDSPTHRLPIDSPTEGESISPVAARS
jgi:hypothetical protein